MQVRDNNGDVVVKVYRTANGKPIVKVWAVRLLFDVSSIVQNPQYDTRYRYEYAMMSIRKQLDHYMADDKVEFRRAARMLWPTPSAPISSMITARVMFALNMISSI